MARKKKEQTQLETDNTQKENSPSLNGTNQGTNEKVPVEVSPLDELSKLDQELFPESYPENPLIKPTEALEEELAEANPNVANNEEISQNESEGVLNGIEQKPQVLFKEDGSFQLTGEFYKDAERWENGELGRNGDFVEVVDTSTPEHYVFDWSNKPIPATLVIIKEMYLEKLVDKVLFAANIGGDLFPQGIRINQAPYACKVLIPSDKLEQFNNLEGKLEYNENESYLNTIVGAINSPTFLKRLFQVGKKGVVMTPNKRVSKVGGYRVSIESKHPIAKDYGFTTNAKKPIYSNEEIQAMKSESLKIICKWYNLEYKGSSQAKLDIKKHYKDLEVN